MREKRNAYFNSSSLKGAQLKIIDLPLISHDFK